MYTDTDLIGKRYVKLLVQSVGSPFLELSIRAYNGVRKRTTYNCLCDCGKTTNVIKPRLLSGKTKSCGCLRKISSVKTHGLASHPAYSAWTGMLQRCMNTKSVSYKNYGARGISVCERWQSVENFISDMGVPPTGYSLERINNNGNYEPSNCRWATKREQALNRRMTVWVGLNGEKLCLGDAEWKLGLSRDTIRSYAVRHKLTIQEAVNHYKQRKDRWDPTINRGQD